MKTSNIWRTAFAVAALLGRRRGLGLGGDQVPDHRRSFAQESENGVLQQAVGLHGREQDVVAEGLGDATGRRGSKRVGDLGADIRTRPSVQQVHELAMKRRRLGAEGLKFLGMPAQ